MPNFFKRRRSAFTLLEETPEKPGFRNCQLGAIWAAKSHFTVSRNHALLNMPTGTGKTGVMIALAFELKARRVFVLAPSRLLRHQTQEKFESLRLLEKLGALRGGLKERPEVLEVTTRPKTADWREMLRYDVVVATPHTVSPSYRVKPPAGFFDAANGKPPQFDLVFVDEAHHSPAATWHAFLQQARGTRVIYLTATPFRRDRRRIRAKPVYGYPISRAMADGIYRPVRFVPVTDPNPLRRDVLLARKALKLFVKERAVNPAAAVIVKAGSIEHAERLLKTYRQQGWQKLDIIHSKREPGDNQKVIQKVRCGRDDGVDPKDRLDGFVSVEMGGEGIDIPNFKIAIFHRAPKTLPYTVQLVGRVSRVEEGQAGDALLLADPKLAKGSEVEELYTSDEGWSEILPGLFERVLDESKFLPEPGSRITHVVSVDDLNPYLSVRVYRRLGPFRSSFREVGERKILALADKLDLEFVVFKRRGPSVLVLTRIWEVPGWTKNRAFEHERYDLHVFHAAGKLLFESTTSEKICARIRDQVYNPAAYDPLGYQRIRKALSDASGGHYYVLGLRNQSGVASGLPEYKTYLGDDVQAALRTADARAFGAGHAVVKKDDEVRGMAINTSRIWSNRRGPLEEFEIWCGRIAGLLGASGQKPIPHVEDKLMGTEKISKYPRGEMPVSIYFADFLLRVRGFQVLLDAVPIDDPVCVFSNWELDREANELDVDLKLDRPVTGRTVKTLRLRHRLAGRPFWKLLSKDRVEVNLDPSRREADLFTPSLDEFLQDYPPLIVFDSGKTLRRNILFTPRIQTLRLDPNDLVAKSWDETDIKKESDPLPADSKYRYNVLQKTTEIIRAEYGLDDSDLLICDDRAHEVADLVLIRPSRKRITFFHLKYKVSGKPDDRTPGSARADVTELIDQGIRTGHWIRAANLMKRLKDRVAGGSIIEHGRPSTLETLAAKYYPDQWTYNVVLVQPGIDRLKVIHAKKPTQTEQLLLMLRDRLTADYGASFKMWTDTKPTKRKSPSRAVKGSSRRGS